jgi:hypothetical protein
MKNTPATTIAAAVFATSLVIVPARIHAAASASYDGTEVNTTVESTTSGGGNEKGFHFLAAVNYFNVSDLTDLIEDHNPSYDVDTVWPIGVTVNPYYEFGNGFAAGMEIGPGIIGSGDADFYVLPVGIEGRYTFMRESTVSPYVRAGVQYAFAGGDFIDTAGAGVYVKAGLEYGHSSRFGWGLEAGYSSTPVEVEPGGGEGSEDAHPYNFTIGIFARY